VTRRSERGQTAVEFALIIPVMLLFVFGIFEVGVTLFNKESLSTAARDGARAGAIHTGNTAPEIYAYVDAAVRANAVGLDTDSSVLVVDAECKPNKDDCVQNDTLWVTVTYPYKIGVMDFASSGTLKTVTKLRME
jgi:Flp pilus assembly protein TadG